MSRGLTVVLAVALALCGQSEARAASPTERLKSFFAAATRTIEDPRPEFGYEERMTAIRGLVREIVDFREAAQLSLGPEWSARTPAERTEFVGLFADIVERSFIAGIAARIRLADGVQVSFLDESVEGAVATVRTAIASKTGIDLPFHYRMVERGQRWAIRDVVIDGVSMAANYRAQFGRILHGGSYAELIRQLRARVPGSGLTALAAIAEDAPAPIAPAPFPPAPIAAPIVAAASPRSLPVMPAVEAPRPFVPEPLAALIAPQAPEPAPQPAPERSEPVFTPRVTIALAQAEAIQAITVALAQPEPVRPKVSVAMPPAGPRPSLRAAAAQADPPAPPRARPSLAKPELSAARAPSIPPSAAAEGSSAFVWVTSEPEGEAEAPAPASVVPVPPPAAARPPHARAFWVQVAAYANVETARRLASALEDEEPPSSRERWVVVVEPGESGAPVARVRVGPFAAWADASSKLKDVQTRGYKPFIAEDRR
jgi:phospholipid transport system substrate-binding protein